MYVDSVVDVPANAVQVEDVERPQVLAHLDDELGAGVGRGEQIEAVLIWRAVTRRTPLRGALLEHTEALAGYLAELGEYEYVGVLQALLGENALPLILKLGFVVVILLPFLFGIVLVLVLLVVVVDPVGHRVVELGPLESVGRRPVVHVVDDLLDIRPDASRLGLLPCGIRAGGLGQRYPAARSIQAAAIAMVSWS